MRGLFAGGGSGFRNERDITLQKVIHGRRQNLGADERRNRHFKDISKQIKDKRGDKQIRPVDWQSYASLSMLRLNSKYAVFTPVRRVSGRAPKMPIGAAANPFYNGFMNSADAPATRGHIKFLRNGERSEKPL